MSVGADALESSLAVKIASGRKALQSLTLLQKGKELHVNIPSYLPSMPHLIYWEGLLVPMVFTKRHTPVKSMMGKNFHQQDARWNSQLKGLCRAMHTHWWNFTKTVV